VVVRGIGFHVERLQLGIKDRRQAIADTNAQDVYTQDVEIPFRRTAAQLFNHTRAASPGNDVLRGLIED
jgi:hypothetical protein